MANEEESQKYLEMVEISFYEAIETDIDIQSYRDKKITQIFK